MKKKPKDIMELDCKRQRVQSRLVERAWQLDKEHTELWQQTERSRFNRQFCRTNRTYCALTDNIDHLVATDKRVCRLLEKYFLWAARITYWNILFDAAYERMQLRKTCERARTSATSSPWESMDSPPRRASNPKPCLLSCRQK